MSENRKTRKVAWTQVPYEDKVAMAGGGKAGFEARQRNGYGDRRAW